MSLNRHLERSGRAASVDTLGLGQILGSAFSHEEKIKSVIPRSREECRRWLALELAVPHHSATSSRRPTKKATSVLQRWTEWIECIAVTSFDVDSGQCLESICPPQPLSLSDNDKKKLCFLALPDSNASGAGDMTYCFRMRRDTILPIHACSPTEHEYFYGFVYYRQRREETRRRGYFQKALVLLTKKPFVSLFEAILSIVAQAYFERGEEILSVCYQNFVAWPKCIPGSEMSLQLLGHRINASIPLLPTESKYQSGQRGRKTDLQQRKTSATAEDINDILLSERNRDDGRPSGRRRHRFRLHSDSSMLYGETEISEEFATLLRLKQQQNEYISEEEEGEESVVSLSDLLMGEKTDHDSLFQGIGLYSTFGDACSQLWRLWELALTAQSILVMASSASLSSKAVLAIVSLISPIQFCGDFRPYFTIYDPDFKQISQYYQQGNSGKGGKASSIPSIPHLSFTLPLTSTSPSSDLSLVLGVTNPFFLKELRHFPNLLVLSKTAVSPVSDTRDTQAPFLSSSTSTPPLPSRVPFSPLKIKTESGSPSLQPQQVHSVLAKTKSFHDFILDGNSFSASQLITRQALCMMPDATVLRQLLARDSANDTCAASAINDTVLRQHFRRLTDSFLLPLEEYLSLKPAVMMGSASNKASSSPFNPYVNPKNLLPAFDENAFLKYITSSERKKPPTMFTNAKFLPLYKSFIRSRNFWPWVQRRLQLLSKDAEELCNVMKWACSPSQIVRGPQGRLKSQAELVPLFQDISAAIDREVQKPMAAGVNADMALVEHMKMHLQAVEAALPFDIVYGLRHKAELEAQRLQQPKG